MAQRDLLNRSIGAGREVTQRTQDRIEALVRELASTAETQATQAGQLVQELVERSRSTTEQVIDALDRELRAQAGALGLATRADLDRLEARIDELEEALAAATALPTTAGPKKAGPKKAGPKKAAGKADKVAKKAGPKKAGPKKAGPKKAGPAKAAADPATGAGDGPH